MFKFKPVDFKINENSSVSLNKDLLVEKCCRSSKQNRTSWLRYIDYELYILKFPEI